MAENNYEGTSQCLKEELDRKKSTDPMISDSQERDSSTVPSPKVSSPSKVTRRQSLNDTQLVILKDSVGIDIFSNDKISIVDDEELNHLIYETFCMSRKTKNDDSDNDIASLCMSDVENEIRKDWKEVPGSNSMKAMYPVNERSKDCIASKSS